MAAEVDLLLVVKDFKHRDNFSFTFRVLPPVFITASRPSLGPTQIAMLSVLGCPFEF